MMDGTRVFHEHDRSQCSIQHMHHSGALMVEPYCTSTYPACAANKIPLQRVSHFSTIRFLSTMQKLSGH